MTMTVTQYLDLSLRGHGPHASYELTGQCLGRQMNFYKEAAASKLPLRHTDPGSRPLQPPPPNKTLLSLSPQIVHGASWPPVKLGPSSPHDV